MPHRRRRAPGGKFTDLEPRGGRHRLGHWKAGLDFDRHSIDRVKSSHRRAGGHTLQRIQVPPHGLERLLERLAQIEPFGATFAHDQSLWPDVKDRVVAMMRGVS